MNAQRFEELAEAYGGDIRRWPEDAREAALAHLDAHADAAGVLLEAARLDALLNAHATHPAGGLLRERILAAAPKRRPAWRAAGAWISGAGLAAACAAGVLLGANLGSGMIYGTGEGALAEAEVVLDETTWSGGLEVEG